MASRSNSSDGDFEVVPRRNSDEFLSLTSALEGEDPYEQRKDIQETKCVVTDLLQKLNFKDESKIDELHEKLKSRDALDAGIVGEIANLQSIVQNEQMATEALRDAAEKAKEHISEARKLALENKTTVKRALDILDIALPVFVRACEISKESPSLSEDFSQLQELYSKTMKEMLQHQQDFRMEQREEKLAEGKGILERSISLATSDRERLSEYITKENELDQLEQFLQAQNEVELMVSTETKELDAWLISSHADYSSIENAVQKQKERFEEATRQYEKRLKSIDTNLHVNKKRQTELLKQLDMLRKEEDRLKNNQVFEKEVQKRAAELDVSVCDELSSLQTKFQDIQQHASTAQEIIMQMNQCSSLLFNSSIAAQKQKEEKLRQLQIEALTREGTALGKAAIEFKVQMKMAEDNINEYSKQLNVIRQEIESAAKKGQALTVTKKRRDLEEYQSEIEKEKFRKEESFEKLSKMTVSLESVNGKLSEFGVNLPDLDALYVQKMEDILLEQAVSDTMSMTSI